jgi:Zn-dependent peptidase ImmA (M78 family)
MVDLARRDADETRRAYWGATLPVNPYEIASKMGVQIRETVLRDGVSAMLIRDVGRDAEIVLAIDDSQQRQYFSCAHELGHYVERTRADPTGEFAFVDYRDNRNAEDLHELYANEFAASLLMPAAAVTQLREREGLGAIALAQRFDVSLPAMQTRLRRLGLPTR